MADRIDAATTIVNEANDATADRVTINTTIVNEAADAVTCRVASISNVAQGVSSEHEQIITAVAN